MHSSEWSQIISHPGPQSFYRIDVYFSYPISIIISRPFSLSVIYCRVLTINPLIASPFIRIAARFLLRTLMNVLLKRFTVGPLDHPQTTLAACAPYGPDYRRAIIFIVAVPALLVCSTSRRICWIAVFFAFFPPHSETSHQSQYQNQSKRIDRASYSHFLVIACATYARSHATSLVPRQVSLCFHPCRLHATATQLVERGGLYLKSRCRCKGCRKYCNLSCIGNPSTRDWCDETHAPVERGQRNEDNVNPVGGNAGLSIPRIVVHSAGQ